MHVVLVNMGWQFIFLADFEAKKSPSVETEGH